MRVRFQQSSRHGQNGTNHSHFAHARYGFRMIDRFLNWGDLPAPPAEANRGQCQAGKSLGEDVPL